MKSRAKKLIIALSGLLAFNAALFVSVGAYIRINNPDAGIRGGDGFQPLTPVGAAEAVLNKTLGGGESFTIEADPYLRGTKAIALSFEGDSSSIEVKGIYGNKSTPPETISPSEKKDIEYIPFNGDEKSPVKENLYYHQFSYDRNDIKAVTITYKGEGSKVLDKALFLMLK